ncbi:unnamed protein product [Didymodactylos carnosus]|uniref:Uncharacterized protein n=1 Tax=Didymodactylos carnosus TaxID=1234261 RepID=A0A814WBV6_9BILA|nr:unnamed protein product [Didymodactylos carnosus]CAF3967479.1 unnamed protein product [Didymodactylos carnosus]
MECNPWEYDTWHFGIPFAGEHIWPQVPQLLTSVCILVSQPLLTFLSQSPNPASHVLFKHIPEQHCAVLLSAVHCLKQKPQLLTSVCTLVSQPLLAIPSQSPNPASHV